MEQDTKVSTSMTTTTPRIKMVCRSEVHASAYTPLHLPGLSSVFGKQNNNQNNPQDYYYGDYSSLNYNKKLKREHADGHMAVEHDRPHVEGTKSPHQHHYMSRVDGDQKTHLGNKNYEKSSLFLPGSPEATIAAHTPIDATHLIYPLSHEQEEDLRRRRLMHMDAFHDLEEQINDIPGLDNTEKRAFSMVKWAIMTNEFLRYHYDVQNLLGWGGCGAVLSAVRRIDHVKVFISMIV